MAVYTAPAGTPLPRTDADFVATYFGSLRTAIEDFAHALLTHVEAFEKATDAIRSAAPKPKHTPPFWAINPAKQKRA